jgi:hypothetical protein
MRDIDIILIVLGSTVLIGIALGALITYGTTRLFG